VPLPGRVGFAPFPFLPRGKELMKQTKCAVLGVGILVLLTGCKDTAEQRKIATLESRIATLETNTSGFGDALLFMVQLSFMFHSQLNTSVYPGHQKSAQYLKAEQCPKVIDKYWMNVSQVIHNIIY
jgi:hypothetical protein